MIKLILELVSLIDSSIFGCWHKLKNMYYFQAIFIKQVLKIAYKNEVRYASKLLRAHACSMFSTAVAL